MMKEILIVFSIFILNQLVFAGAISDIAVVDDKIVYQKKILHPGCFKQLDTQLNGDALSMVVNINFENKKGEFVGRGCIRANEYHQDPFLRNGYWTYLFDDKDIKKILKDPLLRFDGFGYKVAKKISEKVYAIEVREFTEGSTDFLSTIIVEVVENTVFSVEPSGKTKFSNVVGFKKLGEISNGTINWQNKIQEAIENRENLEKSQKKKGKEKLVI